MISRALDFLTNQIWRVRYSELPRRKRFVLRPLRVLLLALRGFDEDRIQIRASALTYYTLLSVVPVLAVGFGVAKGFGVQEALENQLLAYSQGQEEFVRRAIAFANRAVVEARGGVVAGAGILLLFWASARLLSSIEASVNEIWGVRKRRGVGRRFVDYMTIVLIAPILLISSGAITASLAGAVSQLSSSTPMLGPIANLEPLVGRLVPFLIVLTFFFLVYWLIPNTRVSLRAASLAAVVTSLLHYGAQWLFLTFQVRMTTYNAIYGTFSALPLFLIWMQIAWLAVLFGAEVSFAIDHEERYAHERQNLSVSRRLRRVLALRLTQLVTQRFAEGGEAYSTLQLANATEIPVRLAREILEDLVDAKVLVEVSGGDSDTVRLQPARAIDSLTIQSVIESLDASGGQRLPPLEDEETVQILDLLAKLDESMTSGPTSVPLHELPTKGRA